MKRIDYMNTTHKTKIEEKSMQEPNEHKPGYQKTKLGWIPEGWEVVKLNNIADINPSKSKIKNEEILVSFVGMADVSNEGKLINSTSKKFKEIKNGFTPFENGDILIAKITPCFENGKGLLANNLINGKGFGSTEFHVVRVHEDISTEYIYYHTQSYRLRKTGERNMTGTAGQKRVPKDFIKNYKVPLPPFPEQQKIAQILSTWDRAIEQTEKLIEKKQRLKKGLMQQLFKGKMRFEEFKTNTDLQNTKIGLVPKDWETKKASEIFENVSIKNNDGDEELLSATQEYGVVPRNILESKVTMPNGNLKSFKLVEKGDFVISLRTFQGGIEYSFYRGLVSPAYTVLKEKLPIDKDFYRHFFKTKDFISRLASSVIGIRDGKQINYSDFKLMKIIYPSVEEQKKVGEILNGIEKEIQFWKIYNDKLKQQKKGLMQKLLTGKIRVKTN